MVLNFTKNEWPELEKILSGFEQQKPGPFQKIRVKIDGCVVLFFESGKLLIQGANAVQIAKRIQDQLSSGSDLVLGIDETGRGENFGDLCVAGVLGKTSSLRELRDSKKTSDIASKKKIVEQNAVCAVVVSFPAQTIDYWRSSGKTLNELQAKAIDWIVEFVLESGFSPDRILVDGSALPVRETKIEFIPKADDSEPVVGAASVLAKWTRDQTNNKTIRKTWKTKK